MSNLLLFSQVLAEAKRIAESRARMVARVSLTDGYCVNGFLF